MKRFVSLCAALSLFVMAAAGGAAQDQGGTATADIVDADGQSVGTATMTETGDGVDIQVEVTDVEPGVHGIHLHEFGVCEAPDFESAGDHFNPFDKQHGLDNPEGPHAGDLPNIEIGEDGTGTLSYVNDLITIGPGEGSVVDGDGTAIVIHVNEDDQMTDPSGESGDRLACGEVTMADAGETDDDEAAADLVPATGSSGSEALAGIGLVHGVLAGFGVLVLGSGLLLRTRRAG